MSIPTSSDSRFVTRNGAAEYSTTGQLHSYQDVSGLRIVARCKAGAAPRLVRVHGDYGVRTIQWNTSRTGRPPVLPKPGDITDGTTVTDTYIGGSVEVPTPQHNEKEAGYDWTVSGAYTYLQTTNRKLGTHVIPTGGHPHRVLPNDDVARAMIQGAGVSLSPGAETPVADMIEAVAAKYMDHAKLFTWPFTALPTLTVTNGLLG